MLPTLPIAEGLQHCILTQLHFFLVLYAIKFLMTLLLNIITPITKTKLCSQAVAAVQL